MALIQVNFISKSLMRTVPMNVILPVDKLDFEEEGEKEQAPFQTLYLLHGVLGNYTDWVSGTNLQRWAEDKNLAVVMPSGDNMFYVDQEKAHNYYGEFIGKELVEITRRMFPLSHRREDTFIGGLSMGGYGAIRNGLKYHETFGYIAGLSSAAPIEGLEARTDEAQMFFERRGFAERVFGDLSKAKGSDLDPKWLLKKLQSEHAQMPKVYLACGTEDFLLKPNRELKTEMEAAGIDLTYEEGPGGHEWDFWNRSIKKVIDWLPLEPDAKSGINSGNIGK